MIERELQAVVVTVLDRVQEAGRVIGQHTAHLNELHVQLDAKDAEIARLQAEIRELKAAAAAHYVSVDDLRELLSATHGKRKIPLIKAIRACTGVDLREAKELAERYLPPAGDLEIQP